MNNDITLPPLPRYMDSVTAEEFDRRVLAWGRAAVEADRQGRMPGDDEILACLRPLYSGDEVAAMGAEDDLRTARLLLSRYGSGQPAASAEPVAWLTPGMDLHLENPEGFADWVPLYAAPVAAQAQHPDDKAVDRFAAAMKAKLAQKRAEGRGGWEDKTQCSQDDLSLMLRGHVSKGDPVDVANFCMMLHQRGERISGHDAASPSAQDREDDEALADTQRAIIEAAERRGYARAIAECAQAREDAVEVARATPRRWLALRALFCRGRRNIRANPRHR